MNVLDRIDLKYKQILCKILYKSCTKYVVYITNTNFNEKHSNLPIFKVTEKSWILKTFRKESIFIYAKRYNLGILFRSTGAFTS